MTDGPVTSEALREDHPPQASVPEPPRRTSRWSRAGRALLLPAAAIALALVVGAIIMIVSSPLVRGELNWGLPLTAYSALVAGSVGSTNAIVNTLVQATPLVLAGLAVGIGFKAGLFNIGAQGQFLMGALAAAAVGVSTAGLAPIAAISLSLLAGVVAGMAYGFIPGFLKAYTGAHEVVTTIMLNYVAIQIVAYVVSGPLRGEGATFVVRLPAEPDPVLPLADGRESRSVDAERAQIVVVEPDWERFGRLTGPLAAGGVLAVRVDRLEALAPTLGALRPRALVVPFDPASPFAPSLVESAFGAARERSTALVLLPGRGERALVMAFARVVRPDAEETELRLALRAAGAAPRSFGRRPLVVVAAPRTVGVTIGTALTQAGCDHFRVEGVAAARAALAETMPDAGVADPGHAFGLTSAAARRADGASERALGWIAIDAGAPAVAAFADLSAAVEEAGEDPAALLRATAAPLLADAGGAAGRVRAAADTPPRG